MRQTVNPSTTPAPYQRETPNLVYAFIFIVFVCSVSAFIVPRLWNAPSMGDMTPDGTSFQMQDDNGKPVTDRSWPGKLLLVYFGYTHCPDICPTTLAAVAQTLQKLGHEANKVKPVFITVDPARDTPAVMKSYLALFSPRITGLTGTTAQLAEAAQNFGVRFQKVAAEPGETDYSMAHTDSLYLLYPSGAMAMMIPPGQTPQQMASEIADHIP